MSSTAVLVIAHGSRHAPANADLVTLAARLQGRGDGYPLVVPCFLELAEPDIAGGGASCVARGATRVLMVPYFLAAGVHLLRDLTAARDALRARHPGVSFVLGAPLGPHPLLDELVLERTRDLDLDEGSAPAFEDAAEVARRYAPMGEPPPP